MELKTAEVKNGNRLDIFTDAYIQSFLIALQVWVIDQYFLLKSPCKVLNYTQHLHWTAYQSTFQLAKSLTPLGNFNLPCCCMINDVYDICV